MKTPARAPSSILVRVPRTPVKSPPAPRVNSTPKTPRGCRASPALLAIDGCPLDCAKKTLELAGFANVKHVRVTDLGFKKGKTPATIEAITAVVRQAKTLLPNR
jgi:uncharacterized metal-binding protein